LGVRVLQTPALPLGYAAILQPLADLFRPRSFPTEGGETSCLSSTVIKIAVCFFNYRSNFSTFQLD
ncbi:MAG: hypothetical protein ACOYME_11065, partial [Prochlorotrichaceae cyanobacterium]